MKELANKQSNLIEQKELLTFNITIDSILNLIKDDTVVEHEKVIIAHAYDMGKLESKLEVESNGFTYFNENFQNDEIQIN
jgi:hypothetical protein